MFNRESDNYQPGNQSYDGGSSHQPGDHQDNQPYPYNPYGYQDERTIPAWYRPAEKKQGKKLTAGLLALCMIGSGAFGFAGGIASDYFAQGAGEKEILYQSVVRTASKGTSGDAVPTSSEVAATVQPAVVEIKVENITQSRAFGEIVRPGAGSGVIISSDGYIVTNNHVAGGASSITVRLHDGKEYPAKLVGSDDLTDLAILKIEANNLTPAVLGNSDTLAVGDKAIAVGNPLGQLGGSVTQGVVSALDRPITLEDGVSMTLLQTDASINPGNSGGGLFNQYGELIGIVVAKSSGSNVEGIGFAIPVNTAKPVIEDIMSAGYVKGRVGLGLSVLDIQDAFTAMQYQVNQTGLYIADSANSQFRAGDRVIALNQKEVTDLASLRELLKSYKAGDKVVVTVVRDGQSITVNHTLIELKS